MESWFSPSEEPTPVVVQDSIQKPQIIINNIVEKEKPTVIVKEVEKKEEEITW